MTTIMSALVSGLIAASAFTVIGTSASPALSPADLGTHQIQTVQQPQKFYGSQLVHKAVWDQNDQNTFWEQQQDRGG